MENESKQIIASSVPAHCSISPFPNPLSKLLRREASDSEHPRESIVCMLIGRALKYKAHLLGLHPLLLWKVFVKDTGLRGDTEAVDAIIRFAFGETTESLTEKKCQSATKGDPE